MNPISVSTLTNEETPLAVTTPTGTLVPDTSKLDTTIPQLQVTPQEKTQSDLIKRIQAINESLVGKSAYQAEQEKIQGEPELQKIQTDLSSRLKALQSEALAIPLQLQEQFAGRGVTTGGLAPIQAGALRQNAIQSLGISALLEASKGNILLAQEQVARAVQTKYGALEEEQKAKLANLDLLIKDPATTIADKNRAIILQAIENKKTADLAFAKKNEEETRTKALEYASVADSLTLDKMMKSESALKVVQIARSKGLITPAEAKAKAELERIKSQTAKDYAEAQKILIEAKQVGVIGPEELVAFAGQLASTGKTPTGLPKGTFGAVSQLAKEMPKQKGAVIDVNTGVKPDISDAKIDGFAVLLDISKKAEQLKELDKKRIGGVVSGTLGKVFGATSQQQYIDLRTEIIDLLARARTGAALTVSEEKFYASQLPSRFSEPLGLGIDTQKRIENFASKIKGTLDTKLTANSAVIVGFSKIKLGDNEYTVGDILEVNGVRGRILSDGSIVEIK